MPAAPPFRIHSAHGADLWMMPAPVFEGDVFNTVQSLSGLRIRHLASLVEPHETKTLGLERLREATDFHHINLYSFPITDRHPPMAFEGFNALADTLSRRFSAGESTGIHCKSGIGRSGILACAILAKLGLSFDQALALIANHRGLDAPNTKRQLDWLEKFWEALASS